MWLKKRYLLRHGDEQFTAMVGSRAGNLTVQLDDGAQQEVDAQVVMNGRALSLRLGNRSHLVHLTGSDEPGRLEATAVGRFLDLLVVDELHAMVLDTDAEAGGGVLKAEIPGVVIDVLVSVGDTVQRGDPVVVVEAMKMQNELVAPVGGVVLEVLVEKGRSANAGDLLVVIEASQIRDR